MTIFRLELQANDLQLLKAPHTHELRFHYSCWLWLVHLLYSRDTTVLYCKHTTCSLEEEKVEAARPHLA